MVMHGGAKQYLQLALSLKPCTHILPFNNSLTVADPEILKGGGVATSSKHTICTRYH